MSVLLHYLDPALPYSCLHLPCSWHDHALKLYNRWLISWAVSGVCAETGATQIFYGLAAPPTSYGGYGGNAKEAAKCALL